MAGLLTQGQGQPVPPAPVAPAAPSLSPAPVAPRSGDPTPSDETEKPNVSPEEQAQYDEFMNNAYKLIYSDNTWPMVLKRIKASPDPVEAIANIAASTVNQLKDSAEKAGKTLSPDVMFQGGKELLEDLADVVSEAGNTKFSDKDLESAWYKALDIFQQLQGPQSPEQQAGYQQDVTALKGAQASGGLDQMLPGLSQGPGAPPVRGA